MMNAKNLIREITDLRTLFIVYLILSLAGIFTGLWEYGLIQEELNYGLDIQQKKILLIITRSVISILSGLTGLFLIFYFIRWLYHSHHELSSNTEIYYLNHSSKSAIWSWFVPVLNLLLPYQLMRENYETWETLATGENTNSSSLVITWWLLFLASIAAGFFGTGVLEGINSTDLSKYASNPWPFFVPGLVEIAAIWAALRMLNRMKNYYELTVGA